jgi:hypothetical protein
VAKCWFVISLAGEFLETIWGLVVMTRFDWAFGPGESRVVVSSLLNCHVGVLHLNGDGSWDVIRSDNGLCLFIICLNPLINFISKVNINKT